MGRIDMVLIGLQSTFNYYGVVNADAKVFEYTCEYIVDLIQMMIHASDLYLCTFDADSKATYFHAFCACNQQEKPLLFTHFTMPDMEYNIFISCQWINPAAWA